MKAEKANNTRRSNSKSEEMALLGKRIRFLRKKAGFRNYEHFAYEHDLNRSQFGRYEKGEDMLLSTFLRIVKAFGITPEEFFSEGFEEFKTASRKKKKKEDQ